MGESAVSTPPKNNKKNVKTSKSLKLFKVYFCLYILSIIVCVSKDKRAHTLVPKNLQKKSTPNKHLCNKEKVFVLDKCERTTRQHIIIIIIMLDRLFAWCGLHRPGKESGGGGDDTTENRSETDNGGGGGGGDAASDVGSEASSMISVEEIDPTTGRPHRVLKKKRSLIGRAYRKMTKTRSNNNNNKNEEQEQDDDDISPGGELGGVKKRER